MTGNLYRFRSTKYLLGEKYQELENQEIYFSSLDQLNDPMEGFKDLYWSGDGIVWKNLFRHYLLCLDRVYFLFMLNGNTMPIDFSSIPVLETELDLPTPQYKDIYKEVCDTFFGGQSTSQYVAGLPSRKSPMRSNELCWHLRSLHWHALNAVLAAYRNRDLPSPEANSDALNDLCERASIKPEIFDMTNQLEGEHPHVEDGSDRFFAICNGMYSQTALIAKYNSLGTPEDYNRQFILLDFPDRYVKQLQRMIDSGWYTACFSANSSNSSMWGSYGDSHKGVCLKFRTALNGPGHSIPLYGVKGWRSNKIEQSPIYDFSNYPFHEVNYAKRYPEIDFFRSLGSLNSIALGWWYSDGDGNRSSCSNDVYADQEQWREKYWNKLEGSQATKLEDWAYEQEYRLVLRGLITDYSKPSDRKLKYKFEDLEGIIFGMNTTEADKLSIIRIIQAKCHKEGRKDFAFYQAHYARATGAIETAELSLIRPVT